MAILFSKTTTSIALHEKSKIEIQRWNLRNRCRICDVLD